MPDMLTRDHCETLRCWASIIATQSTLRPRGSSQLVRGCSGGILERQHAIAFVRAATWQAADDAQQFLDVHFPAAFLDRRGLYVGQVYLSTTRPSLLPWSLWRWMTLGGLSTWRIAFS